MKSQLASPGWMLERHRTALWVVVFFIFIMVAVPSPAQTLTTLHSFNGTDGSAPSVPLVQSTDGNFYGTTLNGGPSCSNNSGVCGTIFQFIP